jgi:hypothetical protein
MGLLLEYQIRGYEEYSSTPYNTRLCLPPYSGLRPNKAQHGSVEP